MQKEKSAFEVATERFQAAERECDELAAQVAAERVARQQLLERADAADADIRSAEGDIRCALLNAQDVQPITARIASRSAESSACRAMADRLGERVSSLEFQARNRHAGLENMRRAKDATEFAELARQWCNHIKAGLPTYDRLLNVATAAGISVNSGMGWAVFRNQPQVGPFELHADEIAVRQSAK